MQMQTYLPGHIYIIHTKRYMCMMTITFGRVEILRKTFSLLVDRCFVSRLQVEPLGARACAF